MANARQIRSLISGPSMGAAAVALAIVFVLTVAASPAAQAQTYTYKDLHNFTGGLDGGPLGPA